MCNLNFHFVEMNSPELEAAKAHTSDILHRPDYHNDVLSDIIQLQIRKQLSDAENRLASLAASNNNPLDSTITDPIIQHSDLALRIQSYRLAIAPHRKLPMDILLEIFFRCMPSGGITACPHLSGPHAEPHNLIRVCSKWRQLVLHTPEFWRNISVHFKTADDVQRNIILVRNTILLCGSLSLSLHIRVGDNEDMRFTNTQNPISDLVVEFAGRLRHFTWVGKAHALQSFLNLPSGSVDLLENIHLAIKEEYHTGWSFRGLLPCRVFQNADRLRAFTLEPIKPRWGRVTSRGSPFLLNAPWIQITYLELTKYTMDLPSFLLLLYQCPNLCEFRGIIIDHRRLGINDGVSNTLPSHPLVLPNLKRFWIMPCGHIDQLFPCLNFPNLASFQLDLNHYLNLSDPIQWDAIPISPFLKKSSGLTILGIHAFDSVPGNMIHAYLRELPSLVSFSLYKGKPLPELTLEDIASGILVPKLETLKCKMIAFEPFMRMLERRWCVPNDDGAALGISRIRKVAAFARSRDAGKVEAWNCRTACVDKLRAQGLCIKFHVPTLGRVRRTPLV